MPNFFAPFASLREALASRVFGGEIQKRVSLAVKALDDPRDRAYNKTEGDRDRYAYNREQILEQCLNAWRDNPLARRIVELTSDYVVGGGIGLDCEHQETRDFFEKWWNHRLNRMPTRVFEWCDELTRSGELFIILTTDASGMSYVRAVPALDIAEIISAPNDVEQEQSFIERPWINPTGIDARTWPAYSEENDWSEAGKFPAVMLHYAVNKPVGAQRGESDLAPLLKHLRRYDAWLEDRLRLNKYRQAFAYWVHKNYTNPAERLARQAELNANPPQPGTVLVTDEAETWEVLQPTLDSGDAEKDGLALKKTIALGAGIPMHFLAEPEGSTRTTAEQSGGPTFRHYDRRQQFFVWMLADIAHIAVKRRACVDSHVSIRADLHATGTDISIRDNASIALAATRVVEAFTVLRDRGTITDEEMLRMVYRFAGEIIDIPEMLAAAKKEGPPKTGMGTKPAPNPIANPGNIAPLPNTQDQSQDPSDPNAQETN